MSMEKSYPYFFGGRTLKERIVAMAFQLLHPRRGAMMYGLQIMYNLDPHQAANNLLFQHHRENTSIISFLRLSHRTTRANQGEY